MNLPEKLASEIERVSVLRERYRSLDGVPGVNVKPAILMMTAAIDQAKACAGQQDDAQEYMRCIETLTGFEK